MNFKPKTPRDNKYLSWVRSLPCIVCQSPGPNDPHHTETGGMGIKGSDYSTIPLCFIHHREFHDTHGKRGGMDSETLARVIERLNLCYPGEIKGVTK